MLFFNAPKVLMLVYSNYLEVYFTNDTRSPHLDFPKDTLNGQEILNQPKFESLLVDFFLKNKLGGKDFLIVMTEDVTYTKAIPGTSQNAKELLLNFLQELPFNPAQVSGIVLKGTENITLVGTNSQLYMSIKNTIGKTKGKLTAVAPSVLFEQIQKDTPLSTEAVSGIVAQNKLAEANNFLDFTQKAQSGMYS